MGSRKFVKRDHEFSVISRKNFGVAAALEKRAALRSVFPLRRRRNKVIFARGYSPLAYIHLLLLFPKNLCFANLFRDALFV